MATIYISRRVRNVILIGVILFSLLVGIKRSDILTTFLSRPQKTRVVRKTKADKIFASSDYETNIDLSYRTQDSKFVEADKQINDIIHKYQLNTRFNNRSGLFLSYILEIPKDRYNDVLKELTAISGLVTRELATNTVTDTKNLEKEVANLKKTEEVYLKQYKSERLTPRQIKEIQMNITRVGSKIDSLEKKIQERNRRKDFVLARIRMNRLLPSRSTTEQLTKFKTFLSWTAGSFVVCLIALTITYGIYLITTRLLVAAGIKIKRSMGRYGYKYGKYGYGKYGYSGYGGYGDYGYGGRKRKVIKKYIRKDAKPEEEKEQENKTDENKDSNPDVLG